MHSTWQKCDVWTGPQWVTNCNHKHELMSTCSREAAMFYPHRRVICRLKLVYFARKISKNRLVCKNAVTLACYESCRLLIMRFWCSLVYTCYRRNELKTYPSTLLAIDKTGLLKFLTSSEGNSWISKMDFSICLASIQKSKAMLTVYKQVIWYLNSANHRTEESFVSTAK